MEKYCSQNNIPQVDETTPDCNDIVKEQCIVMTEDRVIPIVIDTDEDFKTVLNRLLLHIKTLEDRITVLENA